MQPVHEAWSNAAVDGIDLMMMVPVAYDWVVFPISDCRSGRLMNI